VKEERERARRRSKRCGGTGGRRQAIPDHDDNTQGAQKAREAKAGTTHCSREREGGRRGASHGETSTATMVMAAGKTPNWTVP
jgi:hypothetical protein